MNSKTYEDYLNENGYLTYTFYGVSMNPMLKQGRDLFTVKSKGDERCHKYDVVLYRRRHQYVLHRIVEVREYDYVILGDNCINKEYGIRDEDIIGVLTEFLRNGKKISIESKLYKFYSRFWYAIYPIRKVIVVVKGKLKGWVKRIRH